MRFRQAVKIYNRWLGGIATGDTKNRHQYRKSTLKKAERIAKRWTKKFVKRNK